MCGIVAIFSSDKPINPGALDRATRRLVHRGPDDRRQWIAPHGRIGLGHTRLSIIDLTTGAQPITNEDEQIHIIVNGEFYDFERIRKDLETRGHHFRTRSDSEIAVHLYEDSGTGCLEQLRGEFAFIIWDERNQTLFAVRDRFGIKPLFYAQVNETVYLASEVKALFAAGVEAAWDRESMFQNLFLTFDQDRSLFRRIRQVPAGHYLIASRTSIQIKRYWDADYPRATEQTNHRSEADCIEQTRDLLDEAVRLRMRADVPVGCYVSGGVDSSSVLGIASRHANANVAAFTIAFAHKDYDESVSARDTAAEVGSEFWPIRVTNNDFAEVFTEAVAQGEMIHYNAHGAARYRLSEAVQQAGYKVVLAGEGADELFAGYAFSRAALLSSQNGGLKLPRVLRSLLRKQTANELLLAQTSPWLSRLSRVLAFPPDLLEYVVDKFAIQRSLIASSFADEFSRRDPFKEFSRQFSWRASLLGREPAKQILYLWMKSLFVNYVLAAERLDMAHAVECRLPFLDHKLFEFARSLPSTLLAKNGRQKHLLREAVRPFVRHEVYVGAKQPFLAPPTTFTIGNPMYVLLQDLLRSQNFKSTPFFDQSAVVKLLDEIEQNDERRISVDPLLFMLASVAVLHEYYRL